MDALADQLSHLRSQVAEALGAVHQSRLLHDSDDAELTEAVALAGDLARLVDAVLIEGVAELAHRSRGRDLSARLVRNGVIPLGGAVLPDVAAQFQQIITATSALHARGVRFGDPDAAPDDSFDDGVRILDDRTPAQKAHDAFALALSVAARSGELPTVGGAAPTLVVAVRAEDLESETGWASAEGIDEPVTLSVARYVGCGGVVQRVALNREGRMLRLGTEERLFNRHQRRAIALRDGGCIIPGCGVPAGWCEVHHVLDHAKVGPTHADNGVLLCWWHHRFIDNGPWKIRMNRGVPEVKAPTWFDRTGQWRPVTRSRTRMLDLVGRRT